MPDVVEFVVLADGPGQVVPHINRIALDALVAAYEASREYQPEGGYAGLIPAYFKFGDLADYFLGRADEPWPRLGRAWLLGCDCGEAGCWPLEAAIQVTGGLVAWSDFRQPHRRDRDYRDFGPFIFERDQYQRAVAAAVSLLEAHTE